MSTRKTPPKPAIDLSTPHVLTSALIEQLACPAGKAQAFLRDAKTRGLRVRVTPAGAKSFVFEGKLYGQTLRRTIGCVTHWSIDQARAEARALAVALDKGIDPREQDREKRAAWEAQQRQAREQSATFTEAWEAYLAERSPKWSAAHLANHVRAVKPGGVVALRGTRGRGVTVAGCLHPFVGLKLRELSADTIEAWAVAEAATRPAVARLAWVQLKTFLGWCSEHPAYASAVPSKAIATTRRTREAFGAPQAKSDVLSSKQLPAFFQAVQQEEATLSTYLQVLLLTGARPSEIRELRWADIGQTWDTMHLRDKVAGRREIPITPYVRHLLQGMPRKGVYVFASPRVAGQPIAPPHKALQRVCAAAQIDPALTLHGLRRSFRTLSEWVAMPVGVVAQVQGHKPSATAEKHYTVREMGMLAKHLEPLEAWILETAQVTVGHGPAAPRLRVV